MNIKKQTEKDAAWVDNKGISVPYSRVTGTERLKEKQAYKIATEASKINTSLKQFRDLIETASQDIYERILKENNAEVKDRKGNFTWFNFDRSIKIEVAISERVTFKTPEIDLAKEKLDAFITANLNGVDALIQELVNDAFQNTKGALDAKKVLSLLKYRTKIKAQDFQDALDLIEKSIERSHSRKYCRVWVMAANGEYENIELNFSSI